jgi:hypothetical protein
MPAEISGISPFFIVSQYVAVTFLNAGGPAVVSPIQNERAKRFGFSWWKIAAR